MEELNKIKKLMVGMPSANLELVIHEAVRNLIKNSYVEAERVIRMSLDPKTIKELKKLL